MSKKHQTLGDIYISVIDLLEQQEMRYMIIGGLAVGLIGEARLTQDIDILVAVPKAGIDQLLTEARKQGFTFVSKKKVTEDINLRGVFFLQKDEFHIDFIMGTMPFEEEAFSRRKKIKFFNKNAYFPTPEDLILFKLIASRPKDILDIQSIILRHNVHLDRAYLRKWAHIISDDLQNRNIYQKLEDLLKE